MTGALIAGVGCRRDCSAEAILVLLEQACREVGRRATVLATPAFKAGEPGLQRAARQLGLPVTLVEAGALAEAQARCPTRSPRVLAATGFASVAEACALAVAGADGRLVLPRIAGDGATCALAEVATG